MCIGASPLMREQPRKKAEGIRGEGGWWGGGVGGVRKVKREHMCWLPVFARCKKCVMIQMSCAHDEPHPRLERRLG